LLIEGCPFLQLPRDVLVGIYDPDLESELFAYFRDGGHEIGVVRDYYCHFVVLIKGVQQICSKIDIRAFLLSLDNLDSTRAFAWRVRERHSCGAG
jgi:hypothetical protein